jgi:hypothetical protein
MALNESGNSELFLATSLHPIPPAGIVPKRACPCRQPFLIIKPSSKSSHTTELSLRAPVSLSDGT